MGLGDRRPILPAPTDSLIDSADEAPPSPEQDLATDLSRLTDRTHHSIPDDGTPITIPTGRGRILGKGNPAQQSQASLLIEYFENNNDPDRKPSIRVRLAPSKTHKSLQDEAEHTAVSSNARNSRRLSLHRQGSADSEIVPMTAQRLSRPFDAEYQQTSEISVLSDSPPTRFMAPESDISSMPADSMLGVSNTAADAARLHTSGKENVKPSERNVSSDRLITQKVIEKLANKQRSSNAKGSSGERRSSVGREVDASRARRRTAKHLEDGSMTGSSMLSGSVLSDQPKSHDGRSERSGQSQISINNPKLLQTVEDAIRRLILPELKEIKNDQKQSSHRKHRKEYPSDLSESSVSREEVRRHRSSDKSRRRSSGKDDGHRVSSSSRRHDRSHKTTDESPSEQSYDRSESISSVSLEEDLKARKSRKSHRARDAAAAALAGGALTAAALKHHDSSSSADHRERRKKRSKSRSTRTESIAEDEEFFHKHNVPPMPFRSEVDSTVTRSSLLSSNTTGTMTPTRREVRRVVRGSPGELQSPVSDSSSRTPVEKELPLAAANIQTGLGTHHGNFSNRDLSGSREDIDVDDDDEEEDHMTRGSYGLIGHGLLDPERARKYEQNLHQQHPIRRGLSPIQSVASYATTEPTRNSIIQQRSRETMSSPTKEQIRDGDVSELSYSSANSIDLIKAANRPHGLSLENRSEIMHPYKDQSRARTRDGEGFDSPEDPSRDSFASREARVPLQAQSNLTEDSIDSPYIDKVTAGQQVAYALAANPEYVHTSEGPESAVASLVDASVLSRAAHSPSASYKGSPELREPRSPNAVLRDTAGRRSGSPLRQEQFAVDNDAVMDTSRGISPPVVFAQSQPRSSEKMAVIPVKTSLLADATNNDAQDATSPESEITTNPSVIQGPMGYTPGDTSHWPYGPTPPPMESPVAPGTGRSLPVTAPELVPEPLSMIHGPDQKRDMYINRAMEMTPPGAKDEGYETGANAPSPAINPQQQEVPKGLPFSQDLAYDDDILDDDPFTSRKPDQYVSGLSHGMSPLYDTATGRAADRIYDKDVRALMDHLTVRDAQRNARDTEILVTLVRTAAEMRNSFEDMKKLMAETGDNMIEENSRQHQQTQKAIGGPRPQPPSARVTRTPTLDEEDMSTKRRSVFRRVMGLGNKNAQELQNIESMLVQLLDGFEDMRAQQNGGMMPEPRLTSIHSADNARAPTDTGYEPEGQAGTSSTGDRSGIHSNNSSRQADYRGYNLRQGSGNRVSTVMERDEEYDYDDGYGDEQTTPQATKPAFTRGASEPVHTPPRMHEARQGTLSNEHTPHVSTETSSGRKHKSFASSLLPKMVSRWSKTTASSGGEYRASTLQKPRPYSQVSQSGSNVDGYDYDPQGEDALPNGDIHEDYRSQENRPPSPLIPSQVSDNSPKYQGFRNSVNLQHPQPRAGPTDRYQNQLNSMAQYYTNDPISPTSVTSSQWEAQAAMTGMPGTDLHQGYQHGGQLSPIFDDGMSQRSVSSANRQGPPRPPKEPHDDPLMPPRPPKVVMSPPGNRQSTYVDHVAAARAGSPAFDKSPVAAIRNSPGQARKPSGPRPLSTSGQYTSKGYSGDPNSVKRTRFRGSPNQIDSDENLARHY